MAEEAYNAADPKRVKDHARKEKDAHKQLMADVRAVMSTPAGLRWMQHIIAECRVFQSIYHPSSQIYFLEGQRNVGLRIWAEIEEAAPDMVLQLLQNRHGKEE